MAVRYDPQPLEIDFNPFHFRRPKLDECLLIDLFSVDRDFEAEIDWTDEV